MPQREGGRGARPRMVPAGGWDGPVIPARHAGAEAAWTDGTWRPCVIGGWARPDGGHEGILSPQRFEWLVLLEFETAPDMSCWYCHEPQWLRPS